MRAYEIFCIENRTPNITQKQINDDQLAQRKRAEWKAERAPLIRSMYGTPQAEMQWVELAHAKLELENQKLELERQKAETDLAKSEANERDARAIELMTRSNSDLSDQSQKAITKMALSAIKNR